MDNSKYGKTLDVRGLPPPEPMEHILDALVDLSLGDTLCVHIHREPIPLYEILLRQGYKYQTKQLGEDNFQVLISHNR